MWRECGVDEACAASRKRLLAGRKAGDEAGDEAGRRRSTAARRRAGARARSPRRDADEACPPGVNAPARAASREPRRRDARHAARRSRAGRRALRAARNCRNCRDPIAAVARAETRRKRPAYARRPPHRRAAAPRSNDRHVGLRAADVLPIMARPSGGADDRLRGSARGTTPKPDPGNAGVGMRSAMSRPISARRAAARLSVFPAPFDPRR
ncbi:transporter, basic amino acid/polyamine antiporter (APA) family domain protein [Burkholderia pseudomallei NCTC 13179]|nr:transporter, basic amino acid/polyamine antiporter (APA) family domain protein [Burkholderia pseudomallei NCTC 13179]